MKKLIKFTRYRYFAFVLSLLVIAGGITGVALQGGYNLSIDFQTGLNQRINVAPQAFSIIYEGGGNATVDVRNDVLIIEIRGESGLKKYELGFEEYSTYRALEGKLSSIPGITVDLKTDAVNDTSNIIIGLQFPAILSGEETVINRINDNESEFILIDEVRNALSGLGNPQIQAVGAAFRQEYMVRIEDPDGTQKEKLEMDILSMMETTFGEDTIVVKQSDYVGPRFSSDLARQSIFYITIAFILIAIYIWVRFKLAYALAAIVALIHDVLIMIGFIGTFQLEVSTTTIAAVLTIIGYSLNDTIVVFDRIRENEGLMQDSGIVNIVNTSITQSLSRTIITSITTLIAVTALFIFGSGSIKDFALNLMVGILVGTYSSIFVASPVFLIFTSMKKGKAGHKIGEKPALVSVNPVSGSKPRVVSNEIKHDEIPVAERKLKGKRRKKKR